jgi:hypothetical protein
LQHLLLLFIRRNLHLWWKNSLSSLFINKREREREKKVIGNK